MRQGWESEAQDRVTFARTPGHDHSHDETNMPALLDLLPVPGRATLDVACGESRVARQLQSLGHRVAAIDASPTMVQCAGAHASAAPVALADAT
jgi:2-polyprenyl-3-methyl-5-hydroxy-6-metoxy-1,4-benzoquinol methylase